MTTEGLHSAGLGVVELSLTALELLLVSLCVWAVLSHVMFQASTSEWLARLDLALAGVSEAISVIASESYSIISVNAFIFLAPSVKKT